MPTRWVIGLAAGSGSGGMDAALLEVDGLGVELRAKVVHCVSQAHPVDIRLLLSTLSGSGGDARQHALAHRLLGENLAAAARLVADRSSISLRQVQCVGCQGLAVGYEPDGRFHGLNELGAPEAIAERTGLTTVAGFRWRDLAAGGQASPIGALPDQICFGDDEEPKLHICLSATAQVLYIPNPHTSTQPVGWDAGPCLDFLTGLLERLVGKKVNTDAVGKLAVQGRQIQELLNAWLAHPFFLKKPPRGLAWGAFSDEQTRQAINLAVQRDWSPVDLLCTASHLVVRAVAGSLRQYLPKSSPCKRIVLSGTGARNGMLWRLLEDQFPEVPVESSDAFGVPAESIDAVRSGLLACLALDGVPGSIPSVTGARGPRLLGSITPGLPSNWSRCLEWMSGNVFSAVAEEEE
jgi:anhydro-N-acetylmuramic acid kinase